MSDTTTVKVEGLAELEQKLLAMGQEMGAKAIVAGAYNTAGIIQTRMKSNILSAGLYDSGTLYKAVTRKRIIYDKDGTVVVITGISKNVRGVDDKGHPRVPWRYAPIIEKKYAPFAQDAYEATKDQVVGHFTSYLENKLKRFTK